MKKGALSPEKSYFAKAIFFVYTNIYKILTQFSILNYPINIYFCFTDYAKAFDCVDHNKLWKILKEMGIPGHVTCLLRNL